MDCGKPVLASSPPPHLWLQEQLAGVLPYSYHSRSRSSSSSPAASQWRAPKLLPLSSSAARRWLVYSLICLIVCHLEILQYKILIYAGLPCSSLQYLWRRLIPVRI